MNLAGYAWRLGSLDIEFALFAIRYEGIPNR